MRQGPFHHRGAHSLHILRVQRHHAALALDQLQHNGAGMAVHQLPEALDVTGGGIDKALVEGAKVVVEHLLTGGGQGGNGAAMELLTSVITTSRPLP